MPQVPLTANTLIDLSDGYGGRVIDQGLAIINHDITERGHDGKARKLTVVYTFTPDEGKVDIDVEVKHTVPPIRPPSTKAKMSSAAGGMIFHTESAANPDQRTFADAESE